MAGCCRGDHAGSHPSLAGQEARGAEPAQHNTVGDVSLTGIIQEQTPSPHSERVFYLKLNTFFPPLSLHVPIFHREKQLFSPQWSNNILQMPIRELHPHLAGELSCACSVNKSCSLDQPCCAAAVPLCLANGFLT